MSTGRMSAGRMSTASMITGRMSTAKERLDRTLGAVTMYRLVGILLGITTVASIGLAFAGIVRQDPLALMASAAVAVVTSMASSWIVARIAGAHSHLESSAITGLLVFFVLAPSIEPLGLGAIALASLIASASKFVLAVRGRHVFNPAAIGAVVVTALGLTFSGWWVATAPLLPLVAIGSLLVLYRTRRLTMGLVFIATATIIVVVRTTISGGSIVDGLNFALVSTATVFLAGFMLSEPLTLPPRRWQQLGIAVLVAALFTIPFQLGPLYSSPQLALVIGNLVAFAFGQRRGMSLTLSSKRRLSATTWEFAFTPRRPVDFQPGQYLELGLPHARADIRGQRRVFSISSAPAAELVTIAVKISEPSSSFKRALLDLAPGDTVRATSVGGDFLLPRDTTIPVLLVAGGIGITPFASQLAHARDAGHARDIVVLYALAAGEPPAYVDALEASGARVVIVAPTEPERMPQRAVWAGPGRIDRSLIEAHVPDAATRRAFVSGPPALVDDVRRELRALGARRVTTDYFSGY